MIYLNNGATSWPKAPGLGAYMQKLAESLPVHGSRASGNQALPDAIDGRQELANLMEIQDSRRIAFMENGTHGLNAALLGFPWKSGDLVLTSCAEHNSVLRPLTWLKKHRGIRTVILPVDKEGRISMTDLQTVLQKQHPRLAVFTHASNVTGAVHNLEEIAALVHRYDCLLLADTCQTLGIIPVLPEKWQVDMAAFTGHKYLLGPQGTGGIYVREGISLHPVITGGTGIFSDEEEMPAQMPLRLEAGTQNEQGFQGLGMAVHWQREHPADLEGILQLVSYMENSLRDMGIDTVSVRGPRTPVLSFTVNGFTPEEVGDILFGSYDIICRTGLHCAPLIFKYLETGPLGSVRISLSRFTAKEDIDVLLQAMKEIVSE